MAEFRVLGPLEVTDGETPLDIGGPKPRALIALLAAAAGEIVSTDTLVDALWGEDVPASAVNSLQTYVSRLRKIVGTETIESKAPGYVLDATVDWIEFDRLAAAGQRKLADDPAAAVADLTT